MPVSKASSTLSTSNEDMEWTKHALQFQPLFSVNVVSFNLLAPVYKRLSSLDLTTGFRKRESQKEELWSARALRTADFFKSEVLGQTDIIGLQEFWLGGAYQGIFENSFRDAGYDLHLLKRSGKKLDGVALVVKRAAFEVLGTEHVFLCSVGDRVALLLWLRHRSSGKDLLVANTHLSFPHSCADRVEQMNQMQKLTEVIDSFASRFGISYATRIIMGDFNVESRSPVCDHLRQVGYASCFEVCPPANGMGEGNSADDSSLSDDNEMEVRFISHRTHRSEDLGVDHIFVRPEAHGGPDEVHHHASDDYPRCALKEEPEETIETPRGSEMSEERVFVDNCYVLPKVKNCALWDESFLISDHRPVSATIIFAQPTSLL